MIITKIVLDNIRSHSHFEFEPALDGLTVISGVNGAGKSTIINAFAWSLFGAKAQAKTKVKDYVKEGVDPKETFCGVNSYIVVGNREYRIERRILSAAGGSQCNIYSRPINSEEDYVLDCGPGVVHAENFIRNLLGFDETGFYSSSFIQQKQVDLIVSAGPRERATIIEKMIGVKSITESLVIAREESRALQKALSVIQTGSIEEQEEKVAKQKELVIELTNKLKSIKEENVYLTEEFSKSATKYIEEKLKQDVLNKLKQEELVLSTNLKNFNERLENQLALLSNYNQDITFSEQAYKIAEAEYKTSNKEYLNLEKELALLESEKSKLDELFSNSIDPSIVSVYSEMSSEQSRLKSCIDKLSVDNSILKQDIDKTELFLVDLENGVANCPYCQSPISDIALEKKKHKKLIKENKALLEKNSKIIDEYSTNSNRILSEMVSLQKSLDILSNQNKMKDAYNEINNKLLSLKGKLEIENKLLEKRRKLLQDLTSVKDQAKAIEVTKATIKRINENAVETNSELTEKQAEITKLNALSSKDFRKLEVEYTKLSKAKTDSDLLVVNTQKDLDIAKVTGKALLEELKKQKKAESEYSKISHQLTIINQSIKALTDFKDLRTKTSIPSLSNIATDIFSRFTDGAFTKFTLDEKFETSVETSSGQIRPVTALSGGEESAAAISLRLAIALFLSEGTQSLLVLDEILASMDDHRQQLILETIKELSNAQVILVAHSQVANTFADKLVQLQ